MSKDENDDTEREKYGIVGGKSAVEKLRETTGEEENTDE